MPRYYRRRYTKVVRPKKKWASNIIVWNNAQVNSHVVTLVVNKAQSNAPTPTILKTGNFKVTADMVFSLGSAESNVNPCCLAYVLYVPEGWGSTESDLDNLIEKHPEWIMCTKVMGGGVTTSSASYFAIDTLNMSSRLKRNLNSGDSVLLYFRLNRDGSNVYSLKITGNCRYWTCAN